MPKVLVSTVINAPIERVWRTASDFNGLPAWMPGMKDSSIEAGKKPTEVGAVRQLAMAGTKDVLRERLDDQPHLHAVLENAALDRIFRADQREHERALREVDEGLE